MQVTYGGQSTPWLDNHPRMAFVLRRGASLYRYLVSFQWIVDLVRWMITTGGNVAESAFLLATVYVTINVVAHKLVAWVLPLNMISSLNQISVIAFSVLLELIVAAAIKVTFDHYKMAVGTKKWYAWAWAGLYTLPTIIFLWMTIVTITSFVSLEAINVNYQASGPTLVIRCLAGWSYGMLQTLFVVMGREGYANVFHRLRAEIARLGEVLIARDASITALQSENALLKDQRVTLQNELTNACLALATKKVTRKSDISQKSTFTQSEKSDEKSNFSPISDAKKERLKKHFRVAIFSGEKVNYKKVAADASVSYNMVRRHAKDIISELTQERERDTEKIASAGT
jgi:hypothetical protein